MQRPSTLISWINNCKINSFSLTLMSQGSRGSTVPTAIASTSSSTANKLRDSSFPQLHLRLLPSMWLPHPRSRLKMSCSRTSSSSTPTSPTALECRSSEDRARTVALSRLSSWGTLLLGIARTSHGSISNWLLLRLNSVRQSLALEAITTASFPTKMAPLRDYSARFWATTQLLEITSQFATMSSSQTATGATPTVSQFWSSNQISGTKDKVTFGQLI